MCGICGTVGIDEPGLIQAMTDALHHRGPDDRGHYDGGLAKLGHTRLSIIDIGGGHQPIATPDGAQVIVYNGEIYNYRELRAEMEAKGETFATASDTEVLLRLYQREGADALQKLNGMFAFAVWDEQRQDEWDAKRNQMAINYATESEKLVAQLRKDLQKHAKA